MKKHIIWLIAALLLPVGLVFGADVAKARPNIIWIIGDDHGWSHSEPYGDTWVKTPNMARLAREGMRFTNAFAASPTCSPSRAVMATGLYPYRNGSHVLNGDLLENVRTLPQYFHELGYNVVGSGKFHFSPEKQYPFDQWLKPVEDGAKFLKSYDWQKPLALLVCSHHPHQPWPKSSRYSTEGMPLGPRMIDTPELRKDMARYYEAVSLLDDQIGQVLDELQKAGKEKDTLVLYTSDQGPQIPFAKWCMYDPGLRTPLLVRWPGHVKPGTVTDAMVSLVDVLPTSLELAGATPPKELDGRSFLKVLAGEAAEHRDVVYGEHSGNLNGGETNANLYPMRSVRTKDYLYIVNLAPNRTFTNFINCGPAGYRGCWSPVQLPASKGTRPFYAKQNQTFWASWVAKAQTDSLAKETVQAYMRRPQEELYDVKNDLEQSRNLVGDPKHAAALEHMRGLMADWRKQQGDAVPLCLEPEPEKFEDRVEQWRVQLGLDRTLIRKLWPELGKPAQ